MVYLYTNEFYPAEVRATAMGMGSAVARVGLMTTPFVAQVCGHSDCSVCCPHFLIVPAANAKWLDNLNLYLAMAIYAGFAFAAGDKNSSALCATWS